MVDPRPRSADEKATSKDADKPQNFFARSKSAKAPGTDDHNVDEKDDNITTEVKPVVPEVTPVSFMQLFRYSTKFELCLNALGLVGAAASGAAQPLMALLFGNLTQQFVNFARILADAHAGKPGATEQLPAAAAQFRHSASQSASELVYIGVAMFVCTYTYMSIWIYTGEVNAKRIRELYLQAILRQDIAFFDNVGAGEVTTRIQTDTHLVQQGISEKVGLVVNLLAAFVTGFLLAYIRSWRLALAMSSILPCIAIVGTLINKFTSLYVQLSLKHTAEGGSLAEEVISTVRTAQAFGTQLILGKLYGNFINGSLSVDIKAAAWQGGGAAVFFFIIYSAYALAFSFGTTLINANHATAGEVTIVIFAVLIGSFSLALLAPEMQAITSGRAAAAKLFDTIDRIPEIDSASPEGLKPDKVEGEIVLEDVKFSYPSRPTVQVFKGLNITFRAGETAALVGASGSGKSTIVSLVERFYDPTSGAVELDGVNVKNLNLKWLRSQIGLVSQEPSLFSTTIRGNIAHGLIGTIHENASEEVKEALIKEASIKANADGFITALPLGYDTLVGERGFLLSGGQKQRVAIARAIVSDPRILLLDEATSALDTQSEGIVQDALDKAAAGRTTITIAHRLSTIKNADTIYVMGEGLVIESGTHSDLIQAGGAYSRLVQAQKLREGNESSGQMDSDNIPVDSEHDIEKAAREENPLGRKNTNHSLASEILEQKRNVGEASGKKKEREDYGLFYLFRRMAAFVHDQWKNYLMGTVFACLAGMVYPAFGVVFAQGISSFSLENHARRHEGDRNALWFFIIAILSAISVGLQHYLFAYTASVLTARLCSLSFKAILRQDIEFFDKESNSTGSLTAQLSDNPQKVNGLAGITLGAIVQSIACVIAGSVLGLVFAWRIGLVGIACTPLLVSTGYIRLRAIVLKDQTNKKAHEDSAQLACEAAGSIRTVASLTREADCLALYSKSLEEPLIKSGRTAVLTNFLYAFSQGQVFWIIALVFWYGATLVSHQKLSTMQFFVGLMSTTFGAIQAGGVFSFVPDVSSAQGAGSDIIKLLDSIPEIDAESKEGRVVDPKVVKGHLRFDGIHFRYPTRPGIRVLRDLSLEIEPGTYVALVGASGSGKSTIIQLIERFYDPLAGNIYFDDEKITDLNVQEYRKHLALVSQEPTLYAGTVRFNILLGAIKPHEEVTQQEIEDACRNANILDFIQELPQGFDTEVGGKGSQLSGGQKQRIAIARALLRNPKVLLLDEATSALDSNSEKVVQEALDQAAKGRTTIAIAHRLSSIQNADRIYFIKDGRVSESGSHDRLLEKRGDYYEFVQLQGLIKYT